MEMNAVEENVIRLSQLMRYAAGTATIPADEAVRMQYAQISAPYQPKDRCSYCGARDNGKDQFCAGCGAPL
jgi:hypothetical protein